MPAGRPPKYDPKVTPVKVFEYAKLGLTNEQIAENLGINVDTFYRWQKKYPKFYDAVKEGKAPVDVHVSNSLHERAVGSEWIEQQAIKVKEVIYKDGRRVKETERVEIVDVTRRAPPDTTAMIFWLKNRQPGAWRDKQDHSISGPKGGPVQIEDVSGVEKVRAYLNGIAERGGDAG